MKNLVVVHLESLSQSLWEKHKSVLPSLRKLQNYGKSYSNFYSSATSTAMMMASFFYGDQCPQDHFTSFNQKTSIAIPQDQHLFQILRDKDYSISKLVYPSCWEVDQARVRDWKIWPFEKEVELYFDNRDYFFEGVKKTTKPSLTPWAVYLHPLIAHLSFTDAEKDSAATIHEYFDNGFKFINETIEILLEHLKATDQLDNTIIVLVGDHGDSFFDKSFNKGMCHGTEPYMPMIHCPFIVYDNGKTKEDASELITTADCKDVILNALGMNGSVLEKSFIFSQNMFINQAPSLFLNKSVSIFDGKYLLMVSLLGLEMYNCETDYFNQNNLLSFFDISNDGTIMQNEKLLQSHPHVKQFFRGGYIDDIRNAFRELNVNLYKFIRSRENQMMGELKNPFPEKCFKKIRPRKYYWRYPLPLRMEIPLMIKRVKGWLRSVLVKHSPSSVKKIYRIIKNK